MSSPSVKWIFGTIHILICRGGLPAARQASGWGPNQRGLSQWSKSRPAGKSGLQTSECLIWGAHPPDGLWKPLPYSPAPLVAGSEITDLIHKAFDFG